MWNRREFRATKAQAKGVVVTDPQAFAPIRVMRQANKGVPDF